MSKQSGTNLEREIEALRVLLSSMSTKEIVLTYGTSAMLEWGRKRPTEPLLHSPANQWVYLIGLLLSTNPPRRPRKLNPSLHSELVKRTNAIFDFYAKSHFAEDGETVDADWLRAREIALPSFIDFHMQSLVGSTEQVIEGIKLYHTPFDKVLFEKCGITATDALEIADLIAQCMQARVDALQTAGSPTQNLFDYLMENPDTPFDDAIAEFGSDSRQVRFALNVDDIFAVDTPLLCSKAPESTVHAFIDLLSISRDGSFSVSYPTGDNPFRTKALVRTGNKVLCPFLNQLYLAITETFEKTLSSGSEVAERYQRHRSVVLESEAARAWRAATEETLFRGLYETQQKQFEHDLIVLHRRTAIVVESKASPPVEAFRDPDRSLNRIKRHFKSDRGIQSAYKQGLRIWKQWYSGEKVRLFDNAGELRVEFDKDSVDEVIIVCVTKDNFGTLATDLSLLLEKRPEMPYPWAVCIRDLQSIVNYWRDTKRSTANFFAFLRERAKLHGRVFCSDELDAVGYFIRHGSYKSILDATKADGHRFFIRPTYSKVFDDHYYAKKFSSQYIEPAPEPPNLIAVGKKGFTARTTPVKLQKNGRNDPCPCGSGKKFKRCCLFASDV